MLDGGEPFIVHNADILSDVDLAAMYRAHEASGADATLLVAHRQSSRYLAFGNADSRLHGWINTTTGQTAPVRFVDDPSQYHHLAFGGIHVVSPTVFDTLSRYSTDPVFPIVPYYLSVCDRLDIRAYQPSTDYMWFDIGKPANLHAADTALSTR